MVAVEFLTAPLHKIPSDYAKLTFEREIQDQRHDILIFLQLFRQQLTTEKGEIGPQAST